MSRSYEIDFELSGYHGDKEDTVQNAALGAAGAFDFPDPCEPGEDDEGNPSVVIYNGRGLLGAGESEDEFAKRVARAVWQANGAPCMVVVRTACLDDIPYETHSYGPEDEDLVAAKDGAAG